MTAATFAVAFGPRSWPPWLCGPGERFLHQTIRPTPMPTSSFGAVTSGPQPGRHQPPCQKSKPFFGPATRSNKKPGAPSNPGSNATPRCAPGPIQPRRLPWGRTGNAAMLPTRRRPPNTSWIAGPKSRFAPGSAIAHPPNDESQVSAPQGEQFLGRGCRKRPLLNVPTPRRFPQ